MERDDQVYVRHMLEAARKAHARVAGKSRSDFDANEDLRIVVAHLVQTIGEAARRISAATRDRHAGVPWSAIVGMRHKIVHDYVSLDLDELWSTATEDLPVLIPLLAKILEIED
jgi:uncharacterized protein with HEPN domain